MNIEQVINGMTDKIETLENKVKELEKKPLQAYYVLAKKTNDKIKTLEKKININKDNCVSNNDYKKLWEENTNDYNILARKRLGDYEKIEELESKYYKLRSELDGVYKVLEMDADDIQKLQDETITIKELRKFKDWDDLNKVIKEGK